MELPLGPTLANAFLCFNETTWLQNCPSSFKPVLYKRYVDDIFLLFESPDHHVKFRNYMNQQHPNMKFTDEVEKDGSLSFLDVKVDRTRDKFSTDVYRKDTFSGVLSNFNSSMYVGYKFSLVYTLLHRCFMICSDYHKFDEQVKKLKVIFGNNAYPLHVIDFCILGFLNKMFSKKSVVTTVPQKEIRVVLPYLGKHSLDLRHKLKRLLSTVGRCKLKFVFSTTKRLRNILHFKDRIPLDLHSCVIYKFRCKSCDAFYIGKTYRHFKHRKGEHLGISHLTNVRYNSIPTLRTAVLDHILVTDHESGFDDFEVISSEPSGSNFKLEIRESLLINLHKPTLNTAGSSIPLKLFV